MSHLSRPVPVCCQPCRLFARMCSITRLTDHSNMSSSTAMNTRVAAKLIESAKVIQGIIPVSRSVLAIQWVSVRSIGCRASS